MKPGPLTGVVWTHEGNSHMDELLAAAIIDAHVVPIKTIRRVGTSQLFPESGDIVVDIGDRHKTENGVLYFDHHHNKDLRCSAWLVAEGMAPRVLHDDHMRQVLEIVDKLDREGIVGLCNLLQADDKSYVRSMMFIMDIVLSEFEINPLGAVRQVSRVIKDRKNVFENTSSAVNLLNRDCVVGVFNEVRTLIVPHPDQMGIDKSIFQAAQGVVIDKQDIDVVCGWNERDGFRSRRIYVLRSGKDKVNLEAVKGNEVVTFWHQNNFLVNLKEDTPLDTCMELVREAIRAAVKT